MSNRINKNSCKKRNTRKNSYIPKVRITKKVRFSFLKLYIRSDFQQLVMFPDHPAGDDGNRDCHMSCLRINRSTC